MTPNPRTTRNLTLAAASVGVLIALLCSPGCGTTQVTLPEGERVVESETEMWSPFFHYKRTFTYEGETEGETVVDRAEQDVVESK